MWSTREIAGMENYLNKSADMKVEIEELELRMDPEDSEVCLRYFLMRQYDFRDLQYERDE